MAKIGFVAYQSNVRAMAQEAFFARVLAYSDHRIDQCDGSRVLINQYGRPVGQHGIWWSWDFPNDLARAGLEGCKLCRKPLFFGAAASKYERGGLEGTYLGRDRGVICHSCQDTAHPEEIERMYAYPLALTSRL